MLELLTPVYFVCLGFIAGSWDHEYERRPGDGQEKKKHNLSSDGLSGTPPLGLKAEKPGPEDAITLMASSVQEAASSGTLGLNSGSIESSISISHVKLDLAQHKEVEFAEREK